MSNGRGSIFNIQKYSLHDGPGIRTTVFLKGCPLRCKWCHNPESLSRNPQMALYKDRCTLCGSCVEVCPENALFIEDGLLVLDDEKCTKCGDCENVCNYSAIKVVGKSTSVEEIFKDIDKDAVFYEVSGGGVTFSGGEPFYQPELLLELVKGSKERGYHVAVDTSGETSWENMEKVLPYVDLFLYDLKMVDDEKHKKYVGASNRIILENLIKLDEKNANINLRLPLIKGINDLEEDILKILDFIKDLNNISQINLLEYHSMGKEKYPRLGMVNELTGDEQLGGEKMEAIEKIFEKAGYKVVIGG
ncbi:MAG: glycyl-radical enzyme activating protein [Gallicola sp.]|nr:glycyl-radical enzyme activating protein [Gallicola sp.]